MTQEWLSIVEYARAFDVSDMTIRRRIKTGKLKAVLRDGKYYIPVNEGRSSSVSQITSAPPQVTSPHQNGSHLTSHYSNQGQMRMSNVPSNMTNPSNYVGSSFIGGQSSMAQASIPHKVEYQHIPESIADQVLNAPVCTIGSEDLLSMVDNFMSRLSKLENELTAKFRHKVQHLEQSIKTKDVEIENLKQKIEDVELLVNILEKKQV